MTDGDALAVLTEVSVRFGTRAALDRLTLTLRGGSLHALLGANGSGKSTLLKLLAGRLEPTSGQLRIGTQLGTNPRERARTIGYAAQQAELDPEMSVREHLALFGALYALAPDVRAARIEAVSTQFGLHDFLEQRVEHCSGGMRQRLHLGLSKLQEPRLWLLDEPVAGLDPEAQARLWDALIAHARAGGSALVVSHDVERVAAVADSVILLESGQLRACESPATLIAEHGSMDAAYEALSGRPRGELGAGPRRGGQGGGGGGRGRRRD